MVTYSGLVMDKYNDLQNMNKDMVARSGEDRLPHLKYLTDDTIMDIPNLAPLIYNKYKQPETTPKKVIPQKPKD